MKELPSREELMNTIMNTIKIVWNVGNELHEKDIDNWLANFLGNALCCTDIDIKEAKEREQHIALFMLCNFVFYNKEEVKHLVKLMFEKYLHSIFIKENKITVTDDDIIDLLINTQFSPLGSPSESSSYLLYHFRQENSLSKKNFDKKPNANNIVFVDDFSITGTQARDYIKDFIKQNSEINSKINHFILLMVATKKAINLLKNEIPDLSIIACIEIDEKSQVFSDNSIIFDGYDVQIKDDAKKICEYYGNKLIDENDKKDGMEPLGFRNGGYTFSSYYNIPNNTLPIFWSEKNNWNFIFKRYNKIDKYDDAAFGGQYV